MKYNDMLKIDETDKKIISILQEDPETTHSAIAEQVHKSQPAVGARIIKLRRKHLITESVGAEFNKLDIKFARIELSTKNVSDIWKRFDKCPHVINCFKMTGEFNLMIEIIAPNVKTIESFVDTCLRKDPLILDIRTNFVIDSLRKYVVPLYFEIEKYDESGCSYECGGPMTQKEFKILMNS